MRTPFATTADASRQGRKGRTPIPALSIGLGLILSCMGPAAMDGVAEPSGEPAPGGDVELTSADPLASPVPGGANELPCEGVVPYGGPPPSGGAGTLRLALTQAAASGVRYRLREATFTITGVDGGVFLSDTLSSADAPGGDVLEVPLPSGEYFLRLNDGWSLAALDGVASNSVEAARLSPATMVVRVENGADVPARFRFEVEVPGAELAPRALAPTLGVLERPGPLSGRACVESPIAPEGYTLYSPNDLAVLGGCSEIRGELYLGFSTPVDLAPLSRLTRVCGTLSLSSTAPLNPELVVEEQSLTGLEALEEVDALFIVHSGVRSLAPLARLRRIQRRDVENDVLGLFAFSGGLEDLSGLEQVTEIHNMRLEGDALRSLRGLTLPAEMGSVQVTGSNLADISALANVSQLSGSLYISAGAIDDLDELSHLRSADSISIFAAVLRDARGIAGLEAANYLSLQSSARDAGLPAFEALTRVGDLNFSELSALGPLDFPVLATATSFYIGTNANLTAVRAPSLTSVGWLTIRDNPTLRSLDLPALAAASAIEVTGNASLPAEAVAPLWALGAPVTKIGANAGSSLPLDPCPWAGDSACDEGFYGGLCAPATDGDDCGPID